MVLVRRCGRSGDRRELRQPGGHSRPGNHCRSPKRAAPRKGPAHDHLRLSRSP